MRHTALRFRFGWWQLVFAVGLSVLGATDCAHAEQPGSSPRIIVTGEGKVSVAPDIAQMISGVTARGKTVREAIEANSKVMAGVLTALTESGIPQKDVQTAQLSIQPVYTSPKPGEEQKLAGYSVGNHVNAKIRHIDRLGDVLDRMIAAGATEVWNVEFLVSDPSKTLDQARVAAITDTRAGKPKFTRGPPGSRSAAWSRSKKNRASSRRCRSARWLSQRSRRCQLRRGRTRCTPLSLLASRSPVSSGPNRPSGLGRLI